ncbi:hypothetical protein AB1N83_013343 [Pleurotus pulmonarius]
MSMIIQATPSTLLVHTVMYVAYFVLHCASLFIFKRRKNRTSNPLPTIFASMILFALITAQWTLAIVDTFHSPSIYSGHETGKIMLYIAQTVVGDGFFAYRLYLVWARRWVILIFPGLFILSLLALGASYLILRAAVILFPVFMITLMTNVTITGLITFKVWKTNKDSAAIFSGSPNYFRSKPMKLTRPILLTLLESAGLYTLGVLGTAISSIFHSDTGIFSAFLSAMGPLIGIAFSLIIILVGLGRTVESSNHGAVPAPPVFFRGHGNGNRVRGGGDVERS